MQTIYTLNITKIDKFMSLDIQVFTRITRDTEILLDKVSEEQERSKSFIVRKALEMYLQTNSTN